MTAPGLEALRGELELLRHRVQHEIARDLRDARSYGGGSNNDEYHAVVEEQMIAAARIALLEEIAESAVVVDQSDAGDGSAVIGSTVLVEDLDAGGKSRYRLAGAHAPEPDAISAASPMGQAVMGATVGETVTLDLPNGSSRRLRLLAVEPAGVRASPSPAAREDPVSLLQRWRDHGADYRVLRLSDEGAIIELRSCLGEPVDRLESSDPGLLAYLRRAETDGEA